MTDITQPDIERLAESAAAAVGACERLITSRGTSPAGRLDLAAVRDFIIDQAAATARLAASGTDMDAVLFGNPAMIEAAIRRRLTPGQVAQLAGLTA